MITTIARFRIEKEILSEFQKYCDDNGFILSDILRNYIYDTLSNNGVDCERLKVIHQPMPVGSKGFTGNASIGLRFKVLVRDNFKCCLCGRSPATDSNVKLQVDHKIPNGESTEDNLWTLCESCNQGKGNEVVATVATTLKKIIFDPLTGEPLNQ